MFDFLRVAAAVPQMTVGDPQKNGEAIIEKYIQARKKGADVVVFPELATTGYTCADLFFQDTLMVESCAALEKIRFATEDEDGCAAVGAPLTIGGQLYNCAVILAGGEYVGIIPKTFLPNYGEYYERRWFSSSTELERGEVLPDEVGLEGMENIPIGRDLIFDLGGKVKFGVELCEDLWTPLPPSTFQCLGGAEVILNLSASNETISKRKYRQELIAQQSARNLCAYVYCSAGSGESTQDLVFSGHSAIAQNGAILYENDHLIDTDYLLVGDIDLGRIRADRKKNKSFRDAMHLYGKPMIEVGVNANNGETAAGDIYPVNKLPFVPDAKADRLSRCNDIFQMQVAGLKKRLSVTGSKPVLGISGGLDSTLALLVCAEAIRQLDRPLTDVVGITMPCFGTSDRTYQNALTLMRTLGVTCVEINIRQSCMQHFTDIGHDAAKLDATYENSQARERTQVLMDYASRVGGFVVGTGDLSELALGWCTYNGDQMSMYGVNVSIPKTLVRWLIDSLIEYNVFPASTAVLRDVLDTPISPELLPPDAAGNIAQETESIIGPYALHDFFLFYIMRYGFAPEKIFYLAKRAFAKDFDDATIKKWLRSFYHRFFTQQFKRSCMPDGVKVGSICLSPRGDWRMPSDASAAAWLRAVDQI